MQGLKILGYMVRGDKVMVVLFEGGVVASFRIEDKREVTELLGFEMLEVIADVVIPAVLAVVASVVIYLKRRRQIS